MADFLKICGVIVMMLGVIIAGGLMVALWFIPPGAYWNFWTFGAFLASGFVLISAGAHLITQGEIHDVCRPSCTCKGARS